MNDNVIEPIADPAAMAQESDALVTGMMPMLAGRHPALQGAVLADLVAMWLAGHRPAEIQDDVLADWLETVKKLVPLNAAMIDARRKDK